MTRNASNPVLAILGGLVERVKNFGNKHKLEAQDKNLQVVFEICFPSDRSDPRHLFGETITLNSAGTFSARKTGVTPSGQSIYRACENLEGLKYMLVRQPKTENAVSPKFIFQKKFTTYGPEWSSWQDSDGATTNGEFFWLATRDKDRSGEAERVETPTDQRPKARFRIQAFEDYCKTIRRNIDPTLDEIADIT